LATVDPKIIGAVLLEQADTHLYLSKLVTHPQHLRKGVARALVAQAEALAKEWNLNALELQSRVELIENHLVFERFGFVEVRRTAHAGFSEPTSITFRKSL
jgi:GNAT superfamily N-acetyltransferase